MFYKLLVGYLYIGGCQSTNSLKVFKLITIILKCMVLKHNLIKLFLKKVILKKKYIKILNNKQNIRHLNLLFNNNNCKNYDNLIIYIVKILFSASNTWVYLTDSLGALKFTCSAGNLAYSGKNKKARFLVVKSILRVLFSTFKILKNKPIILHLKNVGFMKF